MRNIVFLLLVVPIAFAFAVCVGALLPDAHWLLDLLAQLLSPAFVIAVVAALIALAARRWRLAGAGALAALSAFAIAWPWTQATPPAHPETAHFTLLQYNVWVRNRSLGELSTAILALNADVVVLLEITPEARDQLRAVDAHYPQSFECWQTSGCDGLVFSKLPIKEPHVDFTGPPDHSPIAWFETTADGCALNIFLTHLTRPFPHAPYTAQFKQADDLAAALRGWPGPKLLVGDLNAVPWGHVVKTVANQANLHVSLGSGGTWPSILPPLLRLPIDHALASEGIGLSNRRVIALPGSDHVAVLTDVTIDDRTRCW